MSVADIRQYLVEEFDNSKKQQNEIYALQDELKKAKEYEIKYNLTLTTLDEYKNRVETVKSRNEFLESQIKALQDTIKEKTNEINNLKLENRKMEKHINNIEEDIRKDIVVEFRTKLSELRGHIKKENVIEILK